MIAERIAISGTLAPRAGSGGIRLPFQRSTLPAIGVDCASAIDHLPDAVSPGGAQRVSAVTPTCQIHAALAARRESKGPPCSAVLRTRRMFLGRLPASA